MPAQHLVPAFAEALQLSPRAQANALRALALDAEEAKEKDWNGKAAAALLLGARWAGERCDEGELARQARVPEATVAKQLEAMAQRLSNVAP
jgi:transcription initiation factor TFIIIB Brf1 subunit/transcription initiation factor TFIIB